MRMAQDISTMKDSILNYLGQELDGLIKSYELKMEQLIKQKNESEVVYFYNPS